MATATPGQRLSERVEAWRQENDRTVAWIARKANKNRVTVSGQIKSGNWTLDCALAVAGVIEAPLEELAS